MHSQVYLALCGASCCVALTIGHPDFSVMVLAASLAIAVLGVPHGGLDHWVGQRLLQPRLHRGWWLAFFPGYLSIGLAFAAGWFFVPTATILAFFLVSAWHFGREDDHATHINHVPRNLNLLVKNPMMQHVVAAAVGGLVIWIPSLFRAEEFGSLLRLITPNSDSQTIVQVVSLTQLFAYVFLPIAGVQMLQDFLRAPRDVTRWVPIATSIAAILLPILLSFTIFFCGWHSWQGLRRLRREEGLSSCQFALHVAPLSTVAVLGVATVGWWLHRSTGLSAVDVATLQVAFIGLSAIAVPHLMLHEVYAFSKDENTNLEVG